MNRTLRILAGAVCAGPALALALAPAALAGGSRTDLDARSAYGQWLEVGATPGLPGNVHRGAISGNWDDDATTSDISAVTIEAWTCPAGVLPPAFGDINGDWPVETLCTFEGTHAAEIGAPVVVVDQRLNSARVTGHVDLGAGSRELDVAFTGVGRTDRDVWTHRESPEDGGRPSLTRLTQRAATFSGRVGGIGLGDDADDAQVLGSLTRMDVRFH